AGVNVLDEMFRAMADAALSPAARAKASSANSVWTPADDLGGWLAEALRPNANAAGGLRARHDSLGTRLPKTGPSAAPEALRRRDLERLYPEGYEATEERGFIAGRARREGEEEAFIGLVGKSVLGAARAWKLADAAWRHADAPPRSLAVFLDCATHA